MMDKRLTVIYADAAEKFVKNVVLYANGEEGGVLYYDEACTEVVNGSELPNLFLKGLVIFDKVGVAYIIPTICVESTEEVIISAEGLSYRNPIVNEEEAESEEEAE